jgi:hypothetical protein
LAYDFLYGGALDSIHARVVTATVEVHELEALQLVCSDIKIQTFLVMQCFVNDNIDSECNITLLAYPFRTCSLSEPQEQPQSGWLCAQLFLLDSLQVSQFVRIVSVSFER